MLRGRNRRATTQVGIDAGDLDVPIYVRKKATSPRPGGERKPGYTTESEAIWAGVEDLPGKQIFISKSKSVIVDYKMTIYYRADLTIKDQILMEDLILRIVTPPQDKKKRKTLMTFFAREVGKDNE